MTFKSVFIIMFIVGVIAIVLTSVNFLVAAAGFFVATSAILYLLVFAGGTHNP